MFTFDDNISGVFTLIEIIDKLQYNSAIKKCI